MRIIKRVLLLATLGLALTPFHLAYAKNVLEPTNIPVPVKVDGSGYTLDEVRQAIIGACQERGWSPRLENDNEIIASILVRAVHYAEVSITFDTNHYSIKYRDSRELKYNPQKHTIHRNYNRWIAMLSDSIQRRFSALAQN